MTGFENTFQKNRVATIASLAALEASHHHDHDKIDKKEDSITTSNATESKVNYTQDSRRS